MSGWMDRERWMDGQMERINMEGKETGEGHNRNLPHSDRMGPLAFWVTDVKASRERLWWGDYTEMDRNEKNELELV